MNKSAAIWRFVAPVLLQVGVVVLDRLHGVAIPPSKMTAIALILALQAYLTVGDLAG